MTLFHLKCYNECIRISKAYRDKVQLTHIVLFKNVLLLSMLSSFISTLYNVNHIRNIKLMKWKSPQEA